MLDLDKIRSRFPALAKPGPDGRPLVHVDAPAGTQVIEDVLDAMRDYLVTSNANQHGAFGASRRTDEMVERVRGQVAEFLGGIPEGVVFGPNMTTLTFHLSRAFAERLRPGDEIVCTRLDHDANVTPWVRAAERAGAEVRFVELDGTTGRLDPASLEAVVTDRTRLVAFPRAANSLGTVVDPAPFVAAARAVGALTFCDAVHGAPHVPIEQQANDIDIVACSAYKFCGPHEGLLSARPEVLAELQPDKLRPSPNEDPERWQTGTAQFENIAGTGAALTYLAEVGMDAVREHELGLSRRFLDGLDGLGHITLHGVTDHEERTPTFAITATGHAPAEVSAHLLARGINTWSGHMYALEPLRALGLLDSGGVVRIGFVHYHGEDDIDRVLDALDELA